MFLEIHHQQIHPQVKRNGNAKGTVDVFELNKSHQNRSRLDQHQDLSSCSEPKRATSTKTSNSRLMAMCDPFELDSTSSTFVPPTSTATLPHHQQNTLYRFDPWYRRHSQIYPESYRNTIASNSSAFHYPSVDYFFKFHQDPVSINPMCSSLTLPTGSSPSTYHLAAA